VVDRDIARERARARAAATRPVLSDPLRIAGRTAAILTVLLAVVVVVVVLLGDDDDSYQVTAEFQNASQLVGGEEVLVAGARVGTVEDIQLSDDAQALVTFTVDDEFAPLPEGTIATIRSQSLAGVANRRIYLTFPMPGEAPPAEIPDGGTIAEAQTVPEVDVDQLFNLLDAEAIADFKRVVTSLDEATRGVGRHANRGVRYLNPLLSTSRRVLAELRLSREALERLIVDSSKLSGALAERAPDISQLVRDLNLTLGAIGRQRAALTAAVSKLPDFLRRSNTTFVNLRAAADDLEPLIAATGPVAERLGPFFRELRAAAADSVPTIRDLDAILRRRGADNDLTELVRLAPDLARAAIGSGRPDCGANPSHDFGAAADDDFRQGALGEATCALRNSLPVVAFLRPYTPELVGWFEDFSTSGVLDANGGIGRIFGAFNAFTVNATNGLPDLLSPVDPATLFSGEGALDVGNNARCPGALERDPGDGSVPFTDGGTLDCDPRQVATGP
jgi:phospholipid/cholesterol/gamma-HCH transport system substrate-binding protein